MILRQIIQIFLSRRGAQTQTTRAQKQLFRIFIIPNLNIQFLALHLLLLILYISIRNCRFIQMRYFFSHILPRPLTQTIINITSTIPNILNHIIYHRSLFFLSSQYTWFLNIQCKLPHNIPVWILNSYHIFPISLRRWGPKYT